MLLPRSSASTESFARATAFALLTLGMLLAISRMLPPFAVWITDNGNKYIVMRNYAETGEAAIRHPAPEFFPTGGFHFVRHKSGYRSFYSEYYPRIAAWWWKLCGERGPGWLSMLGTALTAGMLALLWRKNPVLLLLIVVATPMLFFSFLLWEMTWSVCAALAAWMLLERRHSAAAGIVLGASLLLREEAYCFALAVLAALAWRRDLRAAGGFLVGFALAVIPLWVWQYGEFGHILGLHGGNYYANNRAAAEFSLSNELVGALWNYYHHLLRFDAFRGRFGWLVLAWGFLTRDTGNEAFSAAFVTGAVGSNPLFLPFYLNWRRAWLSRSRFIRDAAVTASVYLLIVPPLLTRSDIGLIYGARHFLCIMPLMLILSAHFLRKKFFPAGSRILPLTAPVAAVMLQCGSLSALANVSRESAELERAINALPEKAVVTDIFFLPEQTPHLFFTKTMLRLDDGNAAALAKYLKKQSPGGFLLVLSADPRFRRISNARLAELLGTATPAEAPLRFLLRPGSGFMDLLIVRCRLK
ncbi:MAG: hypothetical protein IJJ28_02580 [Lentisphaeria bacterium]|nr:hypothetical protein [Lentisphaeria bacterium]